jgi:hypothetical protein
MSEQDDLAQRDAVIERIKQAFPKNPPAKGKKGVKVTQGRSDYASRKLIEAFEGKQWEDMLAYPSLVYEMSDIDFTRVMTDKAYRYYLPAFLIVTLNDPSTWIFTSGPFEKLYKFSSRFNSQELESLISYFKYQIEYRQQYRGARFQIESLENMLAYLVSHRDKLANDKAK